MHGPIGRFHRPNPLDDGFHINIRTNMNINMGNNISTPRGSFWGGFLGGLSGSILGFAQNLGEMFIASKMSNGMGIGGNSIWGGGYFPNNLNRNSGQSIFGAGFNPTPFNIDLSGVTPFKGGAAGSGTASGSTADKKEAVTPEKEITEAKKAEPTDDSKTKKAEGKAEQAEVKTKPTDDSKTKDAAKTPEKADNSKAKEAAKDAGNKLYNAVNDKGVDGKSDTIFSGLFERVEPNKNRENGATLKQDDKTRRSWQKGKTEAALEKDYKDAVRMGDSKGENVAKDKDTGAPVFFTMTDYRSGNEYTFKLSGHDDKGNLQYTIDTAKSNLSHDDKGVNGKNWEFADGAESLVFNVNVNESGKEIELTYSNGEKVALNKLVKNIK